MSFDDRYIYNMRHKSRGIAVIINNSFIGSKFYYPRQGSSVDSCAIQNRLREVGFETDLKDEISSKEMITLMNKYGTQDHRKHDCFMCVIMSYGDEGLVYGSDEKPVEMKKLMEPIKGHKCRSLAGKPKIFIVQACPLREKTVSDAVGIVEEYKTIKIPVEADFLTVFSVIPGHLGWKSKNKPSWFIEALSDAFSNYHQSLQSNKMDFLRLMTRVNLRVSDILEQTKNTDLKLPCVTSLLTKLIYFPDDE